MHTSSPYSAVDHEAAKEVERLEKQILELKQKRVEAQRRVPAQPVKDYQFTGRHGPVSLSGLFEGKNDLLLIHNMGRGCSYCTLWADGFASLYPHIRDRAAFCLTTPDEIGIALEFARARNWPFPVASIEGTDFAMEMGFADHPSKGVWPGVSAFHRAADGGITRHGRSYFGPGDDFCAVWPLLDLLKDGPGEWAPKYHYLAGVKHIHG